jgi:hypothetical protein
LTSRPSDAATGARRARLREGAPNSLGPVHPLLAAVGPVADAVGGTVVGCDQLVPGDIPLEWEGVVVGGLRLPTELHGALDRLITSVERSLGGPLSALSREDKQRAVRLLDERGAFRLRKGVEDVADALGVSRFTVYNYLNSETT